VEFPASERATDTTQIGCAHAAVVRVKRKRRYLRPRIDRRNRIGRRITELEATFSASLGDRELTPLLAHLIRQASELVAMAEEGRARFLRGEHCQLDDVVRAERRAESAVAALRLREPVKREESLLARLAAGAR
jgi:hypothetical protein